MTRLGTILFPSSDVAGHRFAICAVSNCVNAGSLRRVLKSKYDQDNHGIGHRPYSRTALAESVVLNLANVFTYSSVLLYTLKQMFRWDHEKCQKRTHAVSGASLSLFSRRYLTSEINKQPALLNSKQTRSVDLCKSTMKLYLDPVSMLKRLPLRHVLCASGA